MGTRILVHVTEDHGNMHVVYQ